MGEQGTGEGEGAEAFLGESEDGNETRVGPCDTCQGFVRELSSSPRPLPISLPISTIGARPLLSRAELPSSSSLPLSPQLPGPPPLLALPSLPPHGPLPLPLPLPLPHPLHPQSPCQATARGTIGSEEGSAPTRSSHPQPAAQLLRNPSQKSITSRLLRCPRGVMRPSRSPPQRPSPSNHPLIRPPLAPTFSQAARFSSPATSSPQVPWEPPTIYLPRARRPMHCCPHFRLPSCVARRARDHTTYLHPFAAAPPRRPRTRTSTHPGSALAPSPRTSPRPATDSASPARAAANRRPALGQRLPFEGGRAAARASLPRSPLSSPSPSPVLQFPFRPRAAATCPLRRRPQGRRTTAR